MADDEQHRPSLDRLESSSSFHSAFEYDPSAGLHMSGSLHSITERDFPTRELRRLESHALADGSSEAASAGTSEPAGTPTPSTPSGKHAGGLLVRTDTASLHVMAHDVLRVQLMELAKEKAALVEAMRELELREVLLLEEIKQEEEMLGDEIIAAGVLEDEAFDERDDAYAGLVEQYRNILVGYNAIKNSTTVEECVNYIAGLEAVEQVPLVRVVEGNGRWVKSRGWHLAGSHHGNSSQLYRLLAEEVGELLAELDKGRSKMAAHEAGDVLAYALQFVWEFDLGGFFPPEGKDTRFWVDLDQSFAQLQCRKVEDIRAGRSKGLVELRDVLLRLHRSVSLLASSLRTVNGDHQRFLSASEKDKRGALARDVGALLECMVEVTVTHQLNLLAAPTAWVYTGLRAGQEEAWVQSYQCQNRACAAQKEVPTRLLCRRCARTNACRQCGDQKALADVSADGAGTLAPGALCALCVERNECAHCKRVGAKRSTDHALCKPCHDANRCRSCGEQRQYRGQPLCVRCFRASQKVGADKHEAADPARSAAGAAPVAERGGKKDPGGGSAGRAPNTAHSGPMQRNTSSAAPAPGAWRSGGGRPEGKAPREAEAEGRKERGKGGKGRKAGGAGSAPSSE